MVGKTGAGVGSGCGGGGLFCATCFTGRDGVGVGLDATLGDGGRGRLSATGGLGLDTGLGGVIVSGSAHTIFSPELEAGFFKT